MSVVRYKPIGIEKLIVTDTNLSIKGTVKELNIPIPCRVRLFERVSGLLVADKETDNHGNYEFTCLNKLKYFIVAHHPLNQYNAVIADLVVPK
jgi:hypothetical protein